MATSTVSRTTLRSSTRREATTPSGKAAPLRNRKTELKPEVNKRREVAYRIDPATRYVRLPAGL